MSYNTFDIVNTDSQIRVIDPELLNSDPRSFQIETCRKQNLKKCPISKQGARSTMFFNHGKYWNCRHSFHNWIYYASKENNRPINTISPPIIIRQTRHDDPTKLKIIYNSGWSDQELLQMSFIQSDDRVNALYYNDQKGPLGDQMALFDTIQMSLLLNNLVEHDSSLPELSSNVLARLRTMTEVYVMGYAAQTNYFSGGSGDAPGNRLVISNGFVNTGSVQDNLYYFATSNFATGGTSGSPLVSADGTLIGLVCQSDLSDFATNVNLESAQSWPRHISTSFMNSLWAIYGYPSGDVPMRRQAALEN